MEGAKYPDGVSRHAVSNEQLARFTQADRQLASMRVPVLHERNDPDSRIFFAFFDGTGNDRENPSLGKTNIALLHDATQRAFAHDPSIGTFYLPGPGTRNAGLGKGLDGARGYTYDERLETMYVEYCLWSKKQLADNPNARISLAAAGFSRGAEQAAGFTRLVAERGVVDVDAAFIERDRSGLVTKADYSRSTRLVAGNQVAQALLLFDPVGTGTPHRNDRRPPPEVLSGLQITSIHERRDLFPSTRILDPGFTHAGRFLNIAVPGDHSDNGGSYREDGLARRTFNQSADYFNSLMEPPVFGKRHLRPDMDVIHRSLEHLPIYDDDHYRDMERRGVPEGARRAWVDVISGNPKDRRAEARDAEPIDAVLDARFERRKIEIGPVPPTPVEFRHLPPAQERDDLQPAAPRRGVVKSLIGIVAEAEVRGDRDATRAALDAYLASPLGEAYLRQVETRAQAAREAQLATQVQSQEERAPRVRAMAV
jgi:hypothetical protein